MEPIYVINRKDLATSNDVEWREINKSFNNVEGLLDQSADKNTILRTDAKSLVEEVAMLSMIGAMAERAHLPEPVSLKETLLIKRGHDYQKLGAEIFRPYYSKKFGGETLFLRGARLMWQTTSVEQMSSLGRSGERSAQWRYCVSHITRH